MNVYARLRTSARRLRLLTLLRVERLRTGVVYAPFGEAYWTSPYEMYRALQRDDPFHRSLFAKAWVISRYDDVTAVLRDPRFLVDKRKALRGGKTNEAPPSSGDGLAPTMLTLDPPDHTRLRGLVNKAFSPRAVEALRPRIQAIVKECLDAVADAGEMDIVRDLAVPLPVAVIAEMLGLPIEDRERFKTWSDDTTRGIGYPSSAEAERSATSLLQLQAYLTEMAEQRRQRPGNDLMTELLAVEAEGDRLTMAEVVSTCALLLNAGHGMTTSFISNAFAVLLRHPAQLEALRGDLALIPAAVEELLRYDGPSQATGRFVLEDVQISKHRIRAGQQVLVLLGAANHDAGRFADPESLDVTRRDNHHLAFGYGMHRCLGAPLARLEAQVALASVIERFPGLRLATERLDRDAHMFVRGLRSLPVRF